MRLQIEAFGMSWVFVSELSPILDLEEEDTKIREVYSSVGFSRNEEEEE